MLKKVTSEDFRPYGRVLELDTRAFQTTIQGRPATAAGTVVYEPSVAVFEKLPLFGQLRDEVYGGMPVEFGHCSGFNDKLNAVEYHRSSEIDIAATDLILMLGHQQDIDGQTWQYDTQNIELFYVPEGTAVELYATTLHFAPCGIDGREFRCGVVLPKGTNEKLPFAVPTAGEGRLLFAVNKWLIAHKESGLDQDGAWVGLTGKNTTL